MWQLENLICLLLQPTTWRGPHILEYLIQHDYLVEELYLDSIERITRKMYIKNPEKKNICMVPCANYFVNWLFTKCLIQCMQLNAIYLGNLYFFQVVRNITFMISSHVWRMWFYTKMEERKKEKKKKIFFRPLQVDTTNNTSVCYLYPLNIVISKSFLQNKNNLHWENAAKEPATSGGFLKVFVLYNIYA